MLTTRASVAGKQGSLLTGYIILAESPPWRQIGGSKVCCCLPTSEEGLDRNCYELFMTLPLQPWRYLHYPPPPPPTHTHYITAVQTCHHASEVTSDEDCVICCCFSLACVQLQACVCSTDKEGMNDKKMHVKGYTSKSHPCSLSFAVFCKSESGTHLLRRWENWIANWIWLDWAQSFVLRQWFNWLLICSSGHFDCDNCEQPKRKWRC